MGSQGELRAMASVEGVTSPIPAGTKVGNFSLARQASIYSLTLEEFQNTLGEPGKNFGSMNMDEFLKNIWTAEESQAMAAALGAAEGGPVGCNGAQAGLQKQGSLTLPRTLSRKTVDEVWRDMYREGNDGDGNGVARQVTFGEMTLEDFLLKAGVVREETQTQSYGRLGNGHFGDLGGGSIDRNGDRLGINNALALGFSDRGASNGEARSKGGMPPLAVSLGNNAFPNQTTVGTIDMEAMKASQQQTDWLSSHYRTAIAQQQQQQLLHQQAAAEAAAAMYASSMKSPVNGASMGSGLGGGLGLVSTMGGVMGNGFQGGLGVGLGGLGGTTLTIGAGSSANQLSSDGVGTSHGESSGVLPMTYGLEEGMRRRKRGGSVEKVVERRQRRMIKNRESAARSRARKQAYTVELEAEVTQLKEENIHLHKKQEEMLEGQKKQIIEMMAPLGQQLAAEEKALRRTRTGPW